MKLKYLLIAGLAVAVIVIMVSTGGMSSCNMLENQANKPTPTPVEILEVKQMTPIERIQQLEDQNAVTQRELGKLQNRIIELEKAL